MGSLVKKFAAFLCTMAVLFNFYASSAKKVNADVNDIQAFVERNYEYILNRKSDPAGLETWTNLLQSGKMDAAHVVLGFMNSPEYASRNLSEGETVEILYKVMLSRTPDPEGYKLWTNFLYYGVSYAYIVNGFSGSSEFKGLCDSYGIVAGSVGISQARDISFKKTEFVGGLYRNVLGRAPDYEGINDWTLKLIENTSYPEEVARAFFMSPEAAAHLKSDDDYVKACYNGILGRAPSPAEVNLWKVILKNNNRDYVLDSFLATEEFANAVASRGMTFRPVEPKLDYNTKMVALTFDDGPYSPVTNRILDCLEAVDGHATFFVVGDRVPTYESCVTRAESLGCEIGNHTYDHRSVLTSMSGASIQSEITGCNNNVSAVLGHEPSIMRPVGGAYNDVVKANVGMPMINWSVDTQDWKNRNTQMIVNNILNNVQDGDIILMHDLYPATAAAMEIVIPELTRRGYTLVTVSELAEARGVDLKDGTVYTSFRP